jgi:beta-lactamase class C
MPMVFDDLLGLDHVDWAGIESPVKPPTATKPKPKAKASARHRTRRHR